MPSTDSPLKTAPYAFTATVQGTEEGRVKSEKLIIFIVENENDLNSAMGYNGRPFSCITIDQAFLTIADRMPDALIISSRFVDVRGYNISPLKSFAAQKTIPFFLYSQNYDENARRIAMKFRFDDYYWGDVPQNFEKRIEAIKKIKEHKKARLNIQSIKAYYASNSFAMMVMKRTMDILLASIVLLMLFPFLLIIALIIKLESKGPIFYISKRAGNGYKIFDFYKFRSMCNGAEKELHKLSDQNQYGNAAFIKIKNDPRITKFGGFLRSTSLDEIPQLINVIKGDMSLVGNRPLPLYEAEQLTKDHIAWRFLAPAGITGLWQITKRGKEDMSEQERIQLDTIYARKTSFLFDLKILLGTLPALLQKERV